MELVTAFGISCHLHLLDMDYNLVFLLIFQESPDFFGQNNSEFDSS